MPAAEEVVAASQDESMQVVAQPHTYALFSALYAPHVGGVEAYTAGIAHALQERGDRAIVVTSRLSEADPAHEVQPDGVEVFRLPCHVLLGGRLPVPVHDAVCKELLEQVAAAGPDRVVVNTRFYGHSLIGAQFARDNGLPAIIVEHGSAHLSLGNAVADAAIQRYEHHATERIKSFGFPFFAVSEKARQWLGHFGIDGSGIVANALDARAFADHASTRDFRSELALGEDDVLVAVVGRLVPEKGIGAVLEAARYLADASPRIVFAIAGDGPLRTEAESAEGNVVALGSIDPADVAALLRAADAYLLPSRSEGFATTLLEACALEAYPITTDVGGVDELGIGSAGGIVLPDMSAASIVAALGVFNENRALCRAQAELLCMQAQARNSWAASAQQLGAAFGELSLANAASESSGGDADADEVFEGDERLDQLHRVLLMMMKDFAIICAREHLTWMAHYGTAIGALRHGGFIPWDDDIDICMFRDDLEHFEQAVRNDPSGKYSIVNAHTHPGYPLTTTRFVLNGTEFRDSALATMDFPSGIFLDLFPLDALPDDEGAFKRQVLGAWFFNKLATAKLTANPYIAAKGIQGKLMSGAAKMARAVMNVPGIRSFDPNETAYRFLVLNRGKETRRAGYPCDTGPWGCIYEMEDLLPVRWIPFEDMLISVPNKVEEQLTEYYGDWMTPPPGNERKGHYPDILDFGPYANI